MNAWVSSSEPQARLRLFCLPYAGGGSVDYHSWGSRLPSTIEVCPVHLPGRERRLREPPICRAGPMVQAMARALRPAMEQAPFALFGHSMGAWIAFELARELRRQRQTMPIHLFLSARRAPHLASDGPRLSELPEQAFVRAIQERYRAIPPKLLDEPELLALFLPAMRADFALIDNYSHTEEPPLDVPVDAYRGADDDLVTHDQSMAWRRHSTGAFTHRVFPGGHFFLRDSRDLLLDAITSRLRGYL